MRERRQSALRVQRKDHESGNHVHDVRGHQSEVGTRGVKARQGQGQAKSISSIRGGLISSSRAPGHYIMEQVALEKGVKVCEFSGAFPILPSQGKLS